MTKLPIQFFYYKIIISFYNLKYILKSMIPEEYQKMAQLEETYWWFRGRRNIIKAILKKYLPIKKGLRILDYGSGTGGTLSILKEFGTVTGADISSEAIKYSIQKDKSEIHLIQPNQSLPFIENSFDLITTLDVLEHIENDENMLLLIKKYLKPTGFILISVPAYQFLWSEHDEALEHFRRYTASGLIKKITTAGFQPVYKTYAITFAFPIIVAYRLLKKTVKKILRQKNAPTTSYVILPKSLNNFFTTLLKAEAFIIKNFSFPFGSSIFILATAEQQKSGLLENKIMTS